MGWFEGLLTGYNDRRYEVEKEQALLAEQAAKREENAYLAMLNSPDPEVKAKASVGLIQLGQPRRKKGGFSGWVGEMETSPMYPELLRMASEPQEVQESYYEQPTGGPPQPGVPGPSGAIATPPPTQAGSAAQPTTSPTQAGSPGLTPTTAPPPPPPAYGQPSMSMAPGSPTQSAGSLPGVPGGGVTAPSLGAPAAGAAGAGGATPNVAPPPPPGLVTAKLPAMSPVTNQPTATQAPPPPPEAMKTSLAPKAPERKTRTVLKYREVFPSKATLRAQDEQAQIRGKVAEYTEMYLQNGMTPEAAHAAAVKLVEQDVMGKRGAGGGVSRSIRGEYTDPASGETILTHAVYNPATMTYHLPSGKQVDETTFKVIDTQRFAQAFEQAAVAAGYHDGNDVPAWDVERVSQAAYQIGRGRQYWASVGGKEGAYAGPMSPDDAIKNRMPIGTRGTTLTGMVIPTPAEQERKRVIHTIRDQVQGLQTQIAKTLPSEKELSGMAPNAANAFRSRFYNKSRQEFADLQAQVDIIVNALTRSVGEQRGAQTEADAQRAYNSIGQFRTDLIGALSDPMGGDTVESATRRLRSTVAYLDLVDAAIPDMPEIPTPTQVTPPGTSPNVGSPPPTPAPNAPPAAGAPKDVWTTVNGRLHKNGVPF